MGRGVEFFKVEILREGGAVSKKVGFNDPFSNLGPLPGGCYDGNSSVVVQFVLEWEILLQEMLKAGLEEEVGDLTDDGSKVVVELLDFLESGKFMAGEGITAQQLESLQEVIFLPFQQDFLLHVREGLVHQTRTQILKFVEPAREMHLEGAPPLAHPVTQVGCQIASGGCVQFSDELEKLVPKGVGTNRHLAFFFVSAGS